MATMFTRTIQTFRAKAYKLAIDEDGEPTAELIATIDYQGVSDSEAAGRKALREAGYKIPRGCKVDVKKVKEEIYGMSVEEFMQYAHKVER